MKTKKKNENSIITCSQVSCSGTKSACPKSADRPSESHSQSPPHSLVLLLNTTLYFGSLASLSIGEADVSRCIGEQFESLSLKTFNPGVKVHKALLRGAECMILCKLRRSGLELRLCIAGVDSLENPCPSKWDLEDFIWDSEAFSWHLNSILSFIVSKLSFSLEISSSMVSKCEAVRPPRPSWKDRKKIRMSYKSFASMT